MTRSRRRSTISRSSAARGRSRTRPPPSRSASATPCAGGPLIHAHAARRPSLARATRIPCGGRLTCVLARRQIELIILAAREYRLLQLHPSLLAACCLHLAVRNSPSDEGGAVQWDDSFTAACGYTPQVLPPPSRLRSPSRPAPSAAPPLLSSPSPHEQVPSRRPAAASLRRTPPPRAIPTCHPQILSKTIDAELTFLRDAEIACRSVASGSRVKSIRLTLVNWP